jgi:hypothetical protein
MATNPATRRLQAVASQKQEEKSMIRVDNNQRFKFKMVLVDIPIPTIVYQGKEMLLLEGKILKPNKHINYSLLKIPCPFCSLHYLKRIFHYHGHAEGPRVPHCSDHGDEVLAIVSSVDGKSFRSDQEYYIRASHPENKPGKKPPDSRFRMSNIRACKQ